MLNEDRDKKRRQHISIIEEFNPEQIKVRDVAKHIASTKDVPRKVKKELPKPKKKKKEPFATLGDIINMRG